MIDRLLLPLVVVVAALVGVRAVAQAQPQVTFTAKLPNDPKRKGAAPDVEATVIRGPTVPIDKFTLTQPDAKVPVVIKATGMKKYSEGNEAISIIVLLEGHEIWIGNESYVEVEADKYTGVFSKLGPALDALSKVGPSGSQGALMVYGNSVATKVPMGPLPGLTGAKLGLQKDFAGNTTRDLMNAVEKAIGALKEATTARKAIVVIGDGADTNPDDARKAMPALRKAAETEHIELFGIQYVGEGLDAEGSVIAGLIPDVTVAQSMDSIPASMEVIASKINDRYYLTFPGWDPTVKAGFTWDGQGHELMLKIDQQELEPVTFAMLPKWQPAGKGGGFPWLAVIIPVGALLFIIIVVKLLSGKKEPVAMPQPVYEAEQPVALAAAPKPAGPMKTVMIGAGGDTDGFPVVGWLVPLNGPQQHHTFRLQQGMTKIGTGGTAQIVVDDGFMSTEHFNIAGSPHGFTLIDNKSTNGTYVNDSKVDRQELVDNDVITVGKTNLVFKSIN